MNIIFMGTPGFAIPALEALIASAHKVVAVFSQRPKAKGRGMQIACSPVHQLANEHNIQVFTPETLRDDEANRLIESIDADVYNENHRSAICNFKDDEFVNFEVTLNNIPDLLERHQSIKQICITRQTLTDFWEDCFMDTIQYIEQHPERDIQLKLLRSPSRGARRGVIGNFCLFVANRWIAQGYQVQP